MVHFQHEKLFKTAFGKKIVTRDFLRNRLSPEILAQIDLNTLERENTSYVDKNIQSLHSDVVFKVKTSKGNGFFFFLLEHQTQPDPLMPMRLLEYDIAIMRHHTEQQIKSGKSKKEIKLPVIINFVIFTGKTYAYPTRLIDAFHTPAFLYKMFENHFLIDLDKDDKKIAQDGEATLAQLLLKEQGRKDFCELLLKKPDIGDLLNESSYCYSALLYMLDRDPHDAKEVLGRIRNLDSKTKRKMISGLQRMHQESERRGMVKGMEQGIAKGKIEGKEERNREIAVRMILMQLDTPMIAKATGLSTKEIDTLKANIIVL